MTNDIEAAARAAADAHFGKHFGVTAERNCFVAGWLAHALAKNAGGGGARLRGCGECPCGPEPSASCPEECPDGFSPECTTPPPATGEGFAGLPVAYQSSSIGAPPWAGGAPAAQKCGSCPTCDSDDPEWSFGLDDCHDPFHRRPAPRSVTPADPDPRGEDREAVEAAREHAIRADERERCAKVCRDKAVEMRQKADSLGRELAEEAACAEIGAASGAEECAAAIRALRDERGEATGPTSPPP